MPNRAAASPPKIAICAPFATSGPIKTDIAFHIGINIQKWLGLLQNGGQIRGVATCGLRHQRLGKGA
jgi:hypothetical protein